MFGRNDPRKTRAVRGIILQLMWWAANGEGSLNPANPYQIARGVLERALDEMRSHPGVNEMDNALRYLEGKGYVEIQWSPTERGAWEAVTLTTSGIDVVEGTLPDAGVTVSRLR